MAKQTFASGTFRAKTFASGTWVGGVSVVTYPTILLTANAQRNTSGSGNVQRIVPVTANAQRNVGMTGEAEVGA